MLTDEQKRMLGIGVLQSGSMSDVIDKLYQAVKHVRNGHSSIRMSETPIDLHTSYRNPIIANGICRRLQYIADRYGEAVARDYKAYIDDLAREVQSRADGEQPCQLDDIAEWMIENRTVSGVSLNYVIETVRQKHSHILDEFEQAVLERAQSISKTLHRPLETRVERDHEKATVHIKDKDGTDTQIMIDDTVKLGFAWPSLSEQTFEELDSWFTRMLAEDTLERIYGEPEIIDALPSGWEDTGTRMIDGMFYRV